MTDASYDQTHWIPVRARRPLPTYYYRQHFREMLDFVGRHYAHAMRDEHRQFIAEFGALPDPAQCLYVRLVNRKGRLFARQRLKYPELGDLAPIVDTLCDGGWVGAPEERHFDDALAFLTRSDIYALLLPRFAGMSRSMKKADLCTFVRDNVAAPDFVGWLDTDRVLVQRRGEIVRFLLFLYFGRVHDGLSQFTMRDLGLVRAPSIGDHYEPRFSELAEAEEHYYFATRLDELRNADDHRVAALLAESSSWPEANFAGSATVRDELALALGRRAERSKQAELALAVFARGESAACSERSIRLLLARGDRDAALAMIERCLAEPLSDEEWVVAKDIHDRKFGGKRTSVTTDMLRAGEVIDIDESLRGAPERAVVEHFRGLGQAAWRTENLVWRTLFGLLFWEELFAGAGSYSPFDRLPAALASGDFYTADRERIDARIDMLSDRAATRKALLKTSTTHYDKPNGIFRWRQDVIEAMFALLAHADATSLATILRRLCRDYTNSRYGYPDLMAVDADGLRFVEVKTEGDQLRRNQLLRMRELRDAGFRADVAQIRWILDPQQAYTVVDVETTGGRGAGHRVTEIGAVKVVNGEIVDRFQTLLNPQRTIPPDIIRLTGISPAMVADAPVFADVIDDFEALMDGAIFVAHNVEFDYGFVAAEFRRLGRDFRYPRLCTCASMRRLYPGQRSYSLASLCRAFDVPLKQHHRALCDAEAAAELLLLVNEKRAAR